MVDGRNIVFFDGVCNLCNSAVDLLMRMDRRQRLLFAPLQGETAAAVLAQKQIKDMNSIVFFRNGRSYEQSTAVIRILITMGGIYNIARVGLLIPGFIRNPVYKWIARNRYRWFGQKSSCRLPTPEERARFLD